MNAIAPTHHPSLRVLKKRGSTRGRGVPHRLLTGGHRDKKTFCIGKQTPSEVVGRKELRSPASSTTCFAPSLQSRDSPRNRGKRSPAFLLRGGAHPEPSALKVSHRGHAFTGERGGISRPLGEVGQDKRAITGPDRSWIRCLPIRARPYAVSNRKRRVFA
jgi:hypothetical protein